MDLIIKKLASGQRFFVAALLLLGGLSFATQYVYADSSEQEGFVLFTQEDIADWQKENADMGITEEIPDVPPEDKFMQVENAPSIIVIQPGAAGEGVEELLSPIDFIMTFEPQGEAKIDLDSLKVQYKFLGWKDVTKRILKHAEISEEGLQALGADIPKGKHKMRLVIRDTMGREARARITFRVIAEVVPIDD
jgi:hypothetical protein